MRILFLALTILLVACSPTVNAEIYQQGIVHVIYEKTGEKAVKNNADVNENGVPDVIEDIATQINAVRELYHDEFKFPDPLKSARYKNTKVIEVDIDLKSKMNNNNGLAYSGKRKSKLDPSFNAMHMRVASSVDPKKNATPAHEYFHLIQYGATYFRNGWYLEGMARWSQDSVEKVKKYPEERDFAWTLKNKLSEAQIFTVKYKAANLLWYPMAVDLDDKEKIPGSLVKKYKYVDGSPVFKDNVFYGPKTMKKVLEAMKAAEPKAEANFGGQKQWRKDGVRSDKNNSIILDCVREVYEDQKK